MHPTCPLATKIHNQVKNSNERLACRCLEEASSRDAEADDTAMTSLPVTTGGVGVDCVTTTTSLVSNADCGGGEKGETELCGAVSDNALPEVRKTVRADVHQSCAPPLRSSRSDNDNNTSTLAPPAYPYIPMLPPHMVNPKHYRKSLSHGNPRYHPQLVNMDYPGARFMMPEAHDLDLQQPRPNTLANIGGFVPYTNRPPTKRPNICSVVQQLEKEGKLGHATGGKTAQCGAHCHEAQSRPIRSKQNGGVGDHVMKNVNMAAVVEDIQSENEPLLKECSGCDAASSRPSVMSSTSVRGGDDRCLSSGSDVTKFYSLEQDNDKMAATDESFCSSEEPATTALSTGEEVSPNKIRATRSSGLYTTTTTTTTTARVANSKMAASSVCDSGIASAEDDDEQMMVLMNDNDVRPKRNVATHGGGVGGVMRGKEMQMLRLQQLYIEEMQKQHQIAYAKAYHQTQREFQQNQQTMRS